MKTIPWLLIGINLFSLVPHAPFFFFLLQMNSLFIQNIKRRTKTQLNKKSLYMDDIQGTANNGNDLIKFYQTANKIMPEANMPLQEWVFNSTYRARLDS